MGLTFCDHFAGAALALAAVVHEDAHPSGQAVAQVRDLAGVRAGDRLDVLRPAPAGLERSATDHPASDIHDLGLPLPLERSYLVG